jgi:hypothetical protein
MTRLFIFKNVNTRAEIKIYSYSLDYAEEDLKELVKFPMDWRFKESSEVNQTKLFPHLTQL